MFVPSQKSNRLRFATRRLQRASKGELKAFAKALGMEKEAGSYALIGEYYSRAQHSLRAVGRFFGVNDHLTYQDIVVDTLLELQGDYMSACNTLKISYYGESRAILSSRPIGHLEDDMCRYYSTICRAEQAASTGTLAKIAKGVSISGLGAVATRVPLGFVPGIAFITPVAAALSVGYVGHMIMSPNYQKLVPATLVLISIGKRIKHQPKRKI